MSANPNKTRNGRDRLGILNWAQLVTALEKAQRGRDRQRLRNRMAWIQKHRPQMVPAQL